MWRSGRSMLFILLNATIFLFLYFLSLFSIIKQLICTRIFQSVPLKRLLLRGIDSMVDKDLTVKQVNAIKAQVSISMATVRVSK